MNIDLTALPVYVHLLICAAIIAIPVRFTAAITGTPKPQLIASFLAIMVPITAVYNIQILAEHAMLILPIMLVACIMLFVKAGLVSALISASAAGVVYYFLATTPIAGVTLAPTFLPS